MNIRTSFDNPPIPVRSMDWSAVDDNYEPGQPIGHGRTELEAIADLLAQLNQDDPPTVPQSSSPVSQGAESADIGKLDTADKKGFEEVMEWALELFALLRFPDIGLRNATWDVIKRVAQKAALVRELDETPCTGCPMCADADEIALAESGVEMGKVSSVDDVKELRRLLQRYGDHDADCHGFDDGGKCDCGYCEAEILARRLAAGSAETGGGKAAHLPNLSDHCATPGCGHVRAKHEYGAFGYNAASNCHLEDCDCPWWLEPTVPRGSQNQTVSSGVEGAHEGTTADTSECPLCNYANAGESYPDVGKRELVDGKWVHRNEYYPAPTSYDPCKLADPREPEKLNNAQKADWRERAIVALYSAKAAIGENFTGEPDGHIMLDAIDGTLQRLHKPPTAGHFVELMEKHMAESSLSPPPQDFRHLEICLWWHRRPCNRDCLSIFLPSSSLSESGPESAHSGKQNTADKSGTQLPKEK